MFTESLSFNIAIVFIFVLWFYFQVKRNIDLVYGGGSVGLMGLISQKMYDGGCNVLGYVCLKEHVLSSAYLSWILYSIFIHCMLTWWCYRFHHHFVSPFLSFFIFSFLFLFFCPHISLSTCTGLFQKLSCLLRYLCYYYLCICLPLVVLQSA